MKRLLTLMFVAGLMLALATGAQAASFTVTPNTSPGLGIPTTINQNEFIGTFLPGRMFAGVNTVQGFFGANVNYSVLGVGSITFDYFGGEANFVDAFNYTGTGGGTFNHPGGIPGIDASQTLPVASFTRSISGAGLLPFNFLVNGGASAGPVNGANPNQVSGAVPANFFVSCPSGGGNPGGGGASVAGSQVCQTTIWVWLDDNGGLNGVGGSDDNDFDDMLVKITLTDGPPTVPEPTSFALLGSGLLGLGLAARKLRK